MHKKVELLSYLNQRRRKQRFPLNLTQTDGRSDISSYRVTSLLKRGQSDQSITWSNFRTPGQILPNIQLSFKTACIYCISRQVQRTCMKVSRPFLLVKLERFSFFQYYVYYVKEKYLRIGSFGFSGKGKYYKTIWLFLHFFCCFVDVCVPPLYSCPLISKDL